MGRAALEAEPDRPGRARTWAGGSTPAARPIQSKAGGNAASCGARGLASFYQRLTARGPPQETRGAARSRRHRQIVRTASHRAADIVCGAIASPGDLL